MVGLRGLYIGLTGPCVGLRAPFRSKVARYGHHIEGGRGPVPATHPPASFAVLAMNEYKPILSFICHSFVHLFICFFPFGD